MNTLLHTVILPSLSMLPSRMTSDKAIAMLLATQKQEDPDQRRRQWPTGPARGLWQFEREGGVAGVLRHTLTRDHAMAVCHELGNAGTVSSVYHRLEHDDLLACCFARLLLWTIPQALPGRDDPEEGWNQYLKAWRPGKPHKHTWAANFKEAWEAVCDTQS